MKVGIIGLGRMGTAMSQRLGAHGFDLLGWDISAAARQAAASAGLGIATDARLLATDADVIITSITEDHGARTTFTGPEGLLAGRINGKLFIEMSTLQPATGHELAPLVEAKGARLIDAPVLGTIPQVRNGTLVALAGGDAEDVERAGAVLDKLTQRIIHMGPNGSGYAMKLAVNLGLGAYIGALAETLALGARQGLELEKMLDVLQQGPYASGWLKSKLDVLKGAKTDVTIDIRTLRKDLMSAVAVGALSGVPMPLSAGTLVSLSAAVAADYGARDLAELPKFLREVMVQDFV